MTALIWVVVVLVLVGAVLAMAESSLSRMTRCAHSRSSPRAGATRRCS